MALKKHHKILIGSFTTIVIIFMIASGILIYMLYSDLNIKYNEINQNIESYQLLTTSQINELTKNIQQTQLSVSSINQTFNNQIDLLRASTSSDFSKIIGEAVKSVVTVRTDVAQATGFIIDESGYVVTNAHVLSGGHQLMTIDYNQQERTTRLIGYDKDLDIALLKLPKGDYDYLTLADSDQVEVGQKVIAIGNPLGLQFSVSEGIVSAVNRQGSNALDAYIQTDAALNPGNSGGPLIDSNGEVIGINNFKISSGESLGFSLESNYIKEAVNRIAQQQLNQTLIN
ncbi:MAG: trypsin-like peptidase domain-containing protein [Nanoarchaeota archaeon]|nr:trypsin-like peptidase domain-containing protein [Nanoarchaeota archaeon]